MRPIFEQAAALAPGETVEQRRRIGAEPRESGQVMRAGQHVDAVDLVEARRSIRPRSCRLPTGPGLRGRGQSLRRQRDPARGGEGEGFGLHGPA